MGRFKTILGGFWQALPVFLLAFAGFALLCLAFPFFVLLCLALPCGTHFELEVQLACIGLPCFVFLCLALPCLALLCLGLPGFTLPCLASPCLALLYSCAFRSIATQVSSSSFVVRRSSVRLSVDFFFSLPGGLRKHKELRKELNLSSNGTESA